MAMTTNFVLRISELGLTYVAGILPTTMVWHVPAKHRCLRHPAQAAGGPASGCDATRRINRCLRRHWRYELAADAWQTITWRDGSNH